MAGLVRRFGNDSGDPASPQAVSGRSAGVGPIGADTVGASPRTSTPATLHFQVGQQMLQHGAIVSLAGANQHHQWPSAPIDKVMNLAGQPAARAANAVVRRLDRQIRVIRPSPPCHA